MAMMNNGGYGGQNTVMAPNQKRRGFPDPSQNPAFYQPNWGQIFQPSLDRYQQQAQESQNTQEASEWRAPRRGLGNALANIGFGLRNALGLPPTQLQQQMAQRNDPPQPGITGFSPQQQQGIMAEAAARGLNMGSGAQEWQQGFGNPPSPMQMTPTRAKMNQLAAAGQMSPMGGLGQLLAGLGRRPMKRGMIR